MERDFLDEVAAQLLLTFQTSTTAEAVAADIVSCFVKRVDSCSGRAGDSRSIEALRDSPVWRQISVVMLQGGEQTSALHKHSAADAASGLQQRTDVEAIDCREAATPSKSSGLRAEWSDTLPLPRAAAPWSVPWDRRVCLVPSQARIDIASGPDSLSAHVFGPVLSRASRHAMNTQLLAAMPLALYSCHILMLVALLHPDGADATSWTPGICAVASTVLALPLRVLFLSQTSRTVMRMLTGSFDWWLPLLLGCTSYLALADMMQWRLRALLVLPLATNVLQSLLVDAMPDHGGSKIAVFSAFMGAVVLLCVTVTVYCGAVPGLVYRPILQFGAGTGGADGGGDLSRYLTISNLELFRSAQSLVLTLLFKTWLLNWMWPTRCCIIKSGCEFRLVSNNDDGPGAQEEKHAGTQSSTSTAPGPAATVHDLAGAVPTSDPASPELELAVQHGRHTTVHVEHAAPALAAAGPYSGNTIVPSAAEGTARDTPGGAVPTGDSGGALNAAWAPGHAPAARPVASDLPQRPQYSGL